MKKKSILLTLLICGFMSFGQKTVIVNTAEEFVKALQPDCEILIEKSCIVVSDLKPASNPYYEVTEDSTGKSHLVIKGCTDLKISGESWMNSYLVSATETQAVLHFENCSNLTLENIFIAHGPSKGKDCDGAALLFSQCESISIDSCHLFGSGSFGVVAAKYPGQNYGVKKLTCANSAISGCSIGIMTLEYSSDVLFTNCNFIDNRGGISIENSKDIAFVRSNFSFNNYLPKSATTKDGKFISYLMHLEANEKIIFDDCKITNNTFGYLVYDHNVASGLTGSEFCNNEFLYGISYKE